METIVYQYLGFELASLQAFSKKDIEKKKRKMRTERFKVELNLKKTLFVGQRKR
jgi:hypothetical protein